MPNISVISKESHQVLENVSSNKVGLNENSVVVVQVSKDDVASITRENNNALINLRNGEVIVVENYFNAEFADNSLVFQDDTGQLYWVKFTSADGAIADTILYYPIEEIEPLLYSDNFIGGILPWLAGAGVAGIAAAAGGGSDGGDSTPPAPTVNALAAPTVTDDVAPKTGVVANGESTNDTAPTISGSGAQPGATIKVYDGDQLLGETVAKEDGTWEFVPAVPLAEGSHSLTVTQTVSGQESPKSPVSDFTVDTQPPVISIDSLSDTNDTTPTITGKTELGSTVDVVVKDKDGNPVAQGPATVNPDGTWSFTPTTPLPEGNYTVEATAKDAAGNTTSTAPEDFAVDTTPPDISIDPPVNTNDTTPEISGQAEPGSTVDVVVKDKDGNPVAEGPATVNPDGTWSFTPTTPLPEGEYTVDATATDPNGNKDVATPEALVIDTTPPVVSIDPPADTNDTTPEITGKTEPDSTVDVVVKDKDGNPVAQGPATVNPDGTWSFTPTTELPEGEYTVEAIAKDPAGNEQAAAPEQLVVDTTPPDISIDPPVDTNDTTPEISGQAEPGSTVDVVVKDKDGNPVAEGPATVNPDGTWSFTPTTPLPEGEYTVDATATDPNGNKDVATPEALVIDTTPPVVSIDPPADTNDTTPEITGKTEPDSTVDVVVKDKDGNPVAQGPATVNPDGTWSFTPTTELPEGEYTVEAIAKDPAGNEQAAAPEQLVVDTTPPDISIDPPVDTNDTTPEISGQAEPGSTVDVVVKDKDGNPVAEGPATVNPDGTWSFTPTTPLPEGEYTVDATATDPNGNKDVATPEALVIDTTPPVVSIDPPADTNDTTPEITGKTEPDSTVDVVVKDKDGNPVAQGPATVNPDGTWSFTPTTELPEGEYTVEAIAKDPAGNEQAAAPEQLVVDTTPPDISIDPPVDTNDTTPEISGQAEPGSTVDVVVKDKDGNPVAEGPATVNPDGTWSYTPETALPEGEYTVDATATDPNGNTDIAAPQELVIDTTPPEISIDPPVTVNDTTPELTGKTELGSTVDVVVKDQDGNPVAQGPATVKEDGTWTFTPTTELPEGEYTVEATATDPAGNEVTKEVDGLEIDTTPPIITIDPPIDGDDDDWGDTESSAFTAKFSALSIQSDAVQEKLLKTETNVIFHIKNPAYVFTGSTNQDVVKVDLEIRDKAGNTISKGPATTYDLTTDKWTYNTGVKLADGEYTLIAHGVDSANNQTTDMIQFIVDTIAPPVDVVDFGLTNDSTPTFTGTTEAGIQTVRIAVKNEAGVVVENATIKPNADGTWSFTPKNLADGKYTVEAVARDLAGNITPVPDIAGVIVDTTPPPIAIDPVAPTNDTTPEIKGTTEPGATVDVVVKDANGNPVAQGPATVNPDGTWSFTPTTELPEGNYTVEATAKDPAGNEATVDAPVDLVIDTSIPTDVTINAIDLTNDATPEITGTTEPGTTVVVTVTDANGKEVSGPATVNPDGTWSFTPSEDLAEGPQQVVAVATDATGNTAQATEDFVVDTVPPVVTIDPVAPTNDTTPEIKGTTEPGATVDVVVKDANGNPVAQGPATVNPDGTWSFTPTTELPEGNYTVEATAKDPAGNEATVDTPVDLVIDTTAPTNVAIDPIDLTNDATPEITGTTEPGTTVVVTVTDANGKEVSGPATVNPDGTWSFTPSEDLAEGPQKVVAVATDATGNTAQATEDFVVDTVPPVVTIDPVAPTNDTTPEIKGTTEPGATVDVVVKDANGNPVAQGPATVNPDGTWSFTPTTELPEGNYTVEATAKDPAGNEATVDAPIDFVVDTSSPEVSIDPLDITNDATPEITGTTEPGTTVDVIVKDQNGTQVAQGPATVNPDGTWSFTPSEDLPEGEYTVEATAKDPAGNTGSANEDFTVDVGGPVVTIDPIDSTKDTTPEIKGTTELGATVDVVVKDANGNPVAQGPATVNPDGTWSFTPTTELPEGDYTVEAVGKDPLGNKGEPATEDFDVDTTAPIGVSINPLNDTNDNTPTITGKTEPGTSVVVTVTDANGKVVSGAATVNPDGTWTYTPESLADGKQDVVAVATDKAGNTAQAIEDFIVDTVGPVIDVYPVSLTDEINDKTPEFTGKTEPGAKVDLTITHVPTGAVMTATVYADADGNFKYVPFFEAPEGDYNVTGVATDKLGNKGAPDSEEFRVDITPPTNVSINPTDDTNDVTPEITGTTEIGSSVEVTVTDSQGKVVKGPATVNPDGTWTFTPSEDLAEGKQSVVAVAKDKAGNTANATDEFVVDFGGPDITIDPIDETNDTTPTISGQTEPGTTVDVVIKDKDGNTVAQGPATVNPDGTWAFTPATPLPEGEYAVEAVAKDKLGNTSEAVEAFEVDTTAPVVTIDPIDATNDTTPEVTGKSEPDATVDVVIKDKDGNPVAQGPATVNPDGTWSFTPTTPLPEGDYTVEATAKDPAGNTAPAAPEALVIDTTPPVVTIDPPVDTNDTTPEIKGTTEPGATVDVVVKDKDGNPVAQGPATVNPDGTWSFTPTTELPEGNYTVEATAKDPVGNEATVDAPVDLVIDTTAPTNVTIDSIDPTNDATPEITGTTEPGTSVVVTVTDANGKEVSGPATVNPDGTWTFTPSESLAEGEQQVVAVATDKAGNTAEATEDFVVDLSGPAISIDPIDATNDTTPELTGTTEPGSTVDVVVKDANGNPVAQGPATVNPDGSWTFTPATPLPEGEYAVEAVAKDQQGNASNPAVEAFEVDTTPPVITIDPPADTNDTTPELSGQAEPDSTVDVVVKDKDGNPVAQGPATVNPDGSWTFTPATPLPEGEFTVEATAKDPAGNETDAAPEELVVDTTPPVITIDPPEDTNDTTPELTGQVEPGSTVDVVVKDKDGNPVATGPATVNPDGSWTYTPVTPLPEGEFTVEATAKDPAGNETDAAPEDLVIDTTPPVITIDPPEDTNDTTPELTGQVEPGSTVDVVVKDKDGNPVATGPATVNPDGSWTYTPVTPLPEGEFTVEATAKDPAGNETDAAPEDLVIDTTPPIITIDPPEDTNDTTPELTGQVEPGSTVDVVVKDKDGNPVATGPATVNPDGSWTYTPVTPLPEGEFTVEATAKDPAGNETDAAPEDLVIDTTPPIITIDPPVDTNDTTPELTGQVEPGSIVDVVIKDKDGNPVATGPATVNPDGSWTYTPVTPLPEGEFTVEATAKDPAGNETDAAPEDLVIDTTPPIITIDPPVDTNDTTPELTGQVEPGSTVDVVIKDKDGNPVATGPATVNPDGSWTYTPVTPLPEGEFTVEATAKDPAGNETDAAPEDLVIDTTPPIITIDPPVDTNDTTPELTGQVEPGSTVDVVVKDKDGNPVATGPATVNPDGSWTYTPVTPLPEGEYTVDATAKDPAGNEQPSQPVELVVDTTAPEITIHPIGDSQTNATNNQQPPITGTGEPGTTVTLSIVGTQFGYKEEGVNVTVGTDGTWSYVPAQKLPEDTYVITGVPSDAAGNVGTTKTENFEVDTTPPIITIDPPIDEDEDDWWNTFSDQPSTASSVEPMAAFATPIATPVAAPATFAAPMMARMAFSAPIVEESKVAEIGSLPLISSVTTVADKLIEPLPLVTPVITVVDKLIESLPLITPVITVVEKLAEAITSEAQVFYKTKQPTFSGSLVGGAIAVDVVIIRDANGNLIETGPASLVGNRWSYKTQNVLEDGIYQIEAVGKDASGNESNRVELVFEVDTVLPAIEIFDTAPTNDVTPIILGSTSEPSATVTVAIIKDGTVVDKGTAIVDPTTGNWSFTTNVNLADGTYNVEAIAKDKAGNSAKDTNTVTVDIIAPDAPIGSFNDDGSVLDGIAQAGSLVTYKGPNGEILTTKADNTTGAFKFVFSPAIDQGQKVTLTATDVGGTSQPTTVNAPYVSYNHPVDDVAQAFIDYDHPVTERVIDNAISYSWAFGVLGVVLGRDSGSTTFNIGAGKHADIELQIKTGSLKAIFDQVNIVLSKYNTTTGGWDKVASNSDSGIFDFIGFFGEKATVKVNDLAEGQYRVDMQSWSLITKFGYVETDIVIHEVSSDLKVEVSDIHEAKGNVLANDTIVAGTKLTAVDGVVVSDAGVTIKGDYGTLIIKADGSYVYKPNADLNNIGKTELFEYTLTDANGKSTTADLIVQIGTNSGIDLTWDPTDPAKPAVTNLSVSDDVNSAQTTIKKAADVTQSIVYGSAKSVAYYGGQKSDGVSKLAIQSLAEGSTAKIAIKSTLALSQTITGDKFGYQVQYKDSAGNWVNATDAGSSGLVVGSGAHSAGTALFNTSYQANAALSKQWQVVFTTSEANYNLWGTNSTLINTSVQAVISTDKLVSDGVNKAVGNVITDDTGFGADKLASKDDQLFVKNPNTGNFELAKGDVITVAAGKLVLNQNGSYEFTPAANSTSAEVEFEYKLVAPNGVEESATLTIDLGKAFVSTSANDTVALGDGADKLIFNVLNATDKTGGNGHDTWTDFKVENNDKIDISKLLQGSVTEQNIDQYVSVNKVGNDTVISIDRDGSGTNFAKADLVTFKNTDTTLQDLLNNNNLLY